MVQKQLDEDLTIPDSLPRATTPISTHEGDAELPVATQLSPLPSPVGTDYADDADEDIDHSVSPQLSHESPDPLDIITPAEDEDELEPSAHNRQEAVLSSLSPPQPIESSVSVVSAESKHSKVAEPPEAAEVDEGSGLLELLNPSDVVEQSEAEAEIESDKPTAASISSPVEGEMSGEDDSEIVWKDDVSVRSLSGPLAVVHAVGSPLPLADATTSAACTPKTETHETEFEGEFSTLLSTAAELNLAEASGTFEVKEEIQLNENQPEEIHVKQDDEMEIEQEENHEATFPVAEQLQRDRKL